MALAFGASQPLLLAAAASNNAVLVAAAGVVVVLAILLVFVMVLRGNRSSRQRGSGLDYDAQRGPVGQTPAPAAGQDAWNRGGANAQAWQGPASQNQGFGQGYDQGYDQGFGQGLGQGQMPMPSAQGQAWGAPFADQGAGAQPADAWSQPAAADPWGQPAAAAGRSASGANAWGAPQAPQAPGGQMGGAPWETPAASAGTGPAWGDQGAMGGQMGGQMSDQWGGQGGFGAPQGQPGGWGEPQPPQGAPQPPAWGAPPTIPQQPPSQANWGAPAPQPGAYPSGPMSAGRGAASGVPALVERSGKNPGAEYPIRKERITIGRHRDSDIFLEDLAVSRLHTTVMRDSSGQCVLRDENSANGTFVNGQKVTEQVLNDGDEVQVGQTTLVFQRH